MFARPIPALSIVLLTIAALSGCSKPKEPEIPAKVVVSDAWTKEVAEGANGAAYVTLVNEGTVPDRLISVSTDVAKMADVHNHLEDGGVMKMVAVPSLEIPAAGRLVFKPGSLHIMLMGMKHPLAAGETVHLTLNFQETGAVEVDATVLTADEVLDRLN